MKELDANEVERLIDRVGDHIDDIYDFTYSPTFPENRQDVCAVRRMVENGNDYGYDTVYLVWLDESGNIRYREIQNSRSTKDYIIIDSITADGDVITVNMGSNGSFSGNPWSESRTQKL